MCAISGVRTFVRSLLAQMSGQRLHVPRRREGCLLVPWPLALVFSERTSRFLRYGDCLRLSSLSAKLLIITTCMNTWVNNGVHNQRVFPLLVQRLACIVTSVPICEI